ncbi:MAG: carbon-nitrogen hydrolase family protein [Coriobacteriia bacterium]|nr:carbon-nitrogen hydrolase family protein [Coriobacteriia bacterium]
MAETYTAAVVQVSPVLFDREATIDKACELIAEAAEAGAKLVLFPEAFVSAYPRGLAFGTVVGSRAPVGRDLWQRYWDSSVQVPSAATDRLGDAAREAGIYLVIGVIECDTTYAGAHGGGTLYCTILYFGPDGALLGKHRKLKPTAAERLIWGEGDGSTLTAVDTPLGIVGGLICWEHYMPLARYAMYGKGVQVWCAPTADSRDTWQSTMRHIACEGRCWVLGCNQFVTKDMYPADLPEHDLLEVQPEVMSRGGSVVISPLGEVVAGPLWDEEGILYAEIDLAEVSRAKLDFDPVGHYARPDVFRLVVDEREKCAVEFE